MGLPYYRLAKLQAMLGMPIAVSTQSDIIASMMGAPHCMFNYLMDYAAACDLIHQDDTGVKILALIKENQQLNPLRKGMFTSGFLAQGEHKVVLFFSSRAHAGENFATLIEARDPQLPPITRMADALAANTKGNDDQDSDTQEAKCNAHAFRRFRDLLGTHPKEVQHILHLYGKVYDHDEHCKDNGLDDAHRLAYHQQHSEPLMQQLKEYVQTLLADKYTEPNSVLATECRYLLTHWLGLTLFLRTPGVPLDNNILERLLKVMIIYRKNSRFFKTAYSADYGSRLISLIATCQINGVNPIDYLTQLQIHEARVWANPNAWTPWKYQATIRSLPMDPCTDPHPPP